jgi:hypothetical protein
MLQLQGFKVAQQRKDHTKHHVEDKNKNKFFDPGHISFVRIKNMGFSKHYCGAHFPMADDDDPRQLESPSS